MARAKLVRDNIPDLIRRAGMPAAVRVADAGEYRLLLHAKLREEVDEFLASEKLNELVDVLEVILALAAQLGVDADELERARFAKAEQRGAFRQRYVWLDPDG
jgi:predicted house-cleaning noncanonical NTP pyrophosphatase (MazG superfamily)